MPDHGDRAHATWAASASEANFNCPGRIAMLSHLAREDKESFAAAWGTACHQVSDRCLRDGKDAIEFLGTEEKTKEFTIPVDDELVETAQVYIDYVRSRAEEIGADEMLIEQRFSLSVFNPPFDAGGTGDATLLAPKTGKIEIVDLKGGRGVVVAALGNKQLRTYALGALAANKGPWKEVTVTIVQPRAQHPDGRIRSDTFHVADLIDWSQDLIDAMHASREAMDSFGESVSPDWARKHLSAGDHCMFCPAASTCPAIETKSLEVAQTYFDDETGGVAAPPAPEDLPMNKIVRILDAADMIQNWLNAVRAYAQDQAESGIDVTDGSSTYVLTPKVARRAWADGTTALDLGMETGRDVSEFFNEPKMKSPAQVEKLVGKKAFQDLADFVTKNSSGYNLTRSDKTSREAAIPPAKQFFTIERD